MCVIVAKKMGVELPSKKILENCFDVNPDGAGLMYVNENKKIVIEKGFMTFEAFYKKLTELDKKYDLKKKALVMHFRITTQGGTSPENCHPFPITDDEKKLKATYLECNDVAFAHNGIISLYSMRDDKGMSDTMLLSKELLYPLFNYNKKFYKQEHNQELIEEIIGTDKIAFLDNEEKIITIGEFKEDEGVLYSNLNHKKNYNYYNYNYNDYYNYDNYSYNNYNNHELLEELILQEDDAFIESLEDEGYKILHQEGTVVYGESYGEKTQVQITRDEIYDVPLYCMKDKVLYEIDYETLQVIDLLKITKIDEPCI